jgi:5-carboxymethyl-2-hydroxymuconate isomerase
MPHIILEHNIEDEEVVKYTCKKLHGSLAKQETIKLESIKTRSILVSSLILGDGLDKGVFAHVNLKLLPGRSGELKEQMSKALLETLESTIKTGSFSVELNELEAYSKSAL